MGLRAGSLTATTSPAPLASGPILVRSLTIQPAGAVLVGDSAAQPFRIESGAELELGCDFHGRSDSTIDLSQVYVKSSGSVAVAWIGIE